MPAKAARVLGPYKNGKTWRVILVEGDRKTNKVFRSQEEAQAVVETLSAALIDTAHVAMDAAIAKYLDYKQREGLRPRSMRTWADRLRLHLPQQGPLSQITPQRAQALYDEWVSSSSAATHRGRLRGVRAFFAWAIEKGYLASNPFAAVKPVGKPKTGKRQLRVDEAKLLIAYLFEHAESGDERCLGLLLQLMMALRSGEVFNLKARDVDNGATLLCVAMGDEGGKTKNASRSLEVDDPRLQTLLLRQKQGRAADAALFTMRHHNQLHRTLKLICDELKIPGVCPHSLRGLCATLNVSRGATAANVAKALGHGNEEITKRHYIAKGSIEAAGIRRVYALLGTAPIAAAEEDTNILPGEVLDMLRDLNPEQLAKIFSAVAQRR